MPTMKSAQDRMIEYFVGAPVEEAVATLKTAGVIVRARAAKAPVAGVKKGPGRPKKAEGAAAVEGKKRGRPKKAVVTGAMPPLGGMADGAEG